MNKYKVFFILIACCFFVPKQSFGNINGEDTTVPLWPIFYYKSEGEKTKADVLWPVYSYQFDRATNEKAVAVRPFLYSFERRVYSNYSDDYDGEAGSEFWVETKALFGLYRNKKSPVSAAHRLFPLYSFKKDKWVDRKRILNYGTGVKHFYGKGEGSEEYRYFWPFFGKSLLKDGEGAATFKSNYYLWPFVKRGKSLVNDERYTIPLWPLIESRHYSDGYKKKFLPFYLRKHRGDIDELLVFPWYRLKRENLSVKAILPLWYREKTFAGSSDGGRAVKSTKEILLPLYYKEKSKDMNRLFVLPSFFSETTPTVRKRAVFPIWYNMKSENKKTNMVMPFYFRFDTDKSYSSALLPFYVNHINKEKETQFRYYFPFYGYQKYKDVKISNYFMFPLYRKYDNKEAGIRGLDIMWPLYHRFESEETKTLSVIPFYFGREDEKRSLKFVAPFYYKFSNDKREIGGVFPLYYNSELYGLYKKKNIMFLYSSEKGLDRDYKKQKALFNLFYNYELDDDKTTWLFPFYYYKKRGDDFKTVNLWPLYGSRYVKSNQTVEKRKYWLWPIMSAGSKEYEVTALSEKWFSLLDLSSTGRGLFLSKNSIGKRENHLFPLYRYVNDKENEKKRFSVLWRVYRYIKTDSRKLIEVNLLYYDEAIKNKGSYWSVLGGLFGVKTDKNGEKDYQYFWLL